MWLELDPSDIPDELGGLAMQGLALRAAADRSSGLLGDALDVSRALVDDAGVQVFRAAFRPLASTLKNAWCAWNEFGDEEHMCVAVCRASGAWGLGIGARKRNREDAAMVALAGAVAVQRNGALPAALRYESV